MYRSLWFKGTELVYDHFYMPALLAKKNPGNYFILLEGSKGTAMLTKINSILCEVTFCSKKKPQNKQKH